jgi:hypothetical protein
MMYRSGRARADGIGGAPYYVVMAALVAACVGENPSLRASMAEVVRVGSARWVAPNTGAERREGCARVERSVVGRHHLRKRSGAGNKQLRDEDVNTVTTMAHKGVEIGTDGTKGRL